MRGLLWLAAAAVAAAAHSSPNGTDDRVVPDAFLSRFRASATASHSCSDGAVPCASGRNGTEGRCLSRSELCDGIAHCAAAEDENAALCLFHRLELEEMREVKKLLRSVVMEMGKLRQQNIIGKKLNEPKLTYI